jgi:hypothetical protein
MRVSVGKYMPNQLEVQEREMENQILAATLRIKELENELKKTRFEAKQLRKQLEKTREKFRAYRADVLLREKSEKGVNDRVKHHSYGFMQICLCVFLYSRLNLSLRQVRGVMGEFNKSFELGLKVPSAESIRLWSLKLGYHQSEESCKDLKDKEVCVIVDESFQLGEESLLLVLGVDLSVWEAKESDKKVLNQEDVDVLAVESGKSWKAEDIEKVLLVVKEKLKKEGAKISYVVSDRGSSILKSLKMSNLVSIWDCTHYMASFLEKHYKNDEGFKTLMSELGVLRKKWQTGGNSCLIPPKLRTKSRFLNLFEVVKWTKDISNSLKKDLPFWTKERREGVAFLAQHQPLIDEMTLICNALKFAHKHLKNNGLSKYSIEKITQYFDKNQHQNHKYNAFKQYLLDYQNDMINRKPTAQKLIASSDIIESFFGKVKYRKRYLTYQSFHKSIFILPLMNKNISKENAKIALEKFTCQQIKLNIDNKLADSARQIKHKMNKIWNRKSA